MFFKMTDPTVKIFIEFDYDVNSSNNDSCLYRCLRQRIQFIAGEIFRKRGEIIA